MTITVDKRIAWIMAACLVLAVVAGLAYDLGTHHTSYKKSSYSKSYSNNYNGTTKSVTP